MYKLTIVESVQSDNILLLSCSTEYSLTKLFSSDPSLHGSQKFEQM